MCGATSRTIHSWGPMADLDSLEIMGRLALATVLGLAMGLEREIDGHEAGARTHALLALGAAVFGLISVGAFDDFITSGSRTNVRVDVTRVASYVAAGIGFLGAGSIMKRSDGPKGLTTAASLWVAAGSVSRPGSDSGSVPSVPSGSRC